MKLFLVEVLSVLLAVQAPQTPEAPQAIVGGVVRDGATGEPLPRAVVALPDLGRSIVTDTDGRYLVQHVPPGPQHVAVRMIGYAPRTLHALVPTHGQLEVNVSLRAQPVRLRTIEVRAPVAIRGVDGDELSASPDRESSIAAIRNHPLMAEPDVLQALGGGDVTLRPESPSGVHIRGGASDHIGYLLDDIPVFSPYHAGGVFSAWNPDAIAALRLSADVPSPAQPSALSGIITAVTRPPDARIHIQGGISTTQARFTLSGPLGARGSGYLVSLRSGFPAAIAPRDDASYLRGGTGDRLAKLEAPMFGGHVRLLAYDSENQVEAAAGEVRDGPSPVLRRNVFAWHSRSMGGEWRRVLAGATIRVVGWSATGDATAAWTALSGPVNLAAGRRDLGLLAAVERNAAGATTTAGIRIEHSHTSYQIGVGASVVAGDGASWTVTEQTPVASAFVRHATAIDRRTELEFGGALIAAVGELYPGPRVLLRWTPSATLTFSTSYARLYQFAQSLRNPESVVGTVFPADIYLGAGPAGVPVARSDQGVIAAAYRPAAGVRVGMQIYERGMNGLLLVAPQVGEPFAMDTFAVGSGRSRGASIDAAVSTAHYGVVASYGFQHVRLRHADATASTVYVPDYGATHQLEAGVIVFPTATWSIRSGVTGIFGRRTTTANGVLEWEACNLLDRGCEFAGSPRYDGQPLGATALPPYVRVDLGIRKHWHMTVGGRDALVAVFGTVTNLFNRKNVLTYVRSHSADESIPVEMRPLAPLVVGLDWQF